MRSTYEQAAVRLLEANSSVIKYEYEHRFVLEDGHSILPDFLVRYADETCLVEVKPSWILGVSRSEKVWLRLSKSQRIATENGWTFAIWTEKDVLEDALRNAA